MKNSILLLLIMFLFLSNEKANNNLIQKNDDWESLFDGKTLNGWHRYNLKGCKAYMEGKKRSAYF